MTDQAASLLHSADQARLAYDNAGALALYAAALTQPNLPADIEFDLRDGRATVNLSLGRLDQALSDAAAALALAEAAGDRPRQARALLQLAQTYSFLGQYAPSQDSAQKALGLAGQLGDSVLEAEAHLNAAVAHYFLNEWPASRESAGTALRLARESGNQAVEVRTLQRLGLLEQRADQTSAAELFLRQALEVARLAGDRRLEGLSLNMLGINTADLAEQRSRLEQALAIFTGINELRLLPAATNNLALTYLALGLIGKARRFARRAVSLAREVSGPVNLAVYLETLAQCELADPERARAAFNESIELGRQRTFGFCCVGLGQLALRAGNLPEARRQFETANTAIDGSGSAAELAIAGGWLAMICLAEGDWAEADRLSAQAVARLEALDSPGAWVMPQELWWCRHQILLAQPGGPNPAALWAVLESSRQWALTGIANISDAGLRRNSLNKIHYTRDLLAAWANLAAERAAAKRPRRKAAAKKSARPSARAQKAQAANLQEQFKRLLEIGARLNELGDAEALPTFIIDELVELTGAERAALVLAEPNGARRVLAAHDSITPLPSALDGWLPSEAGPVLDAARLPLLRLDLEDLAASAAAPELQRRSAMAAPLVVRSQVRGWLYVDNRDLFGPFTQDDLDLFSAFANQAATALENALLIQGLEQRVAERTAALEQRAAELEIINSVQQGLVAQLDYQAIIELVGNKLRDLFSAENLNIRLYDAASNTVTIPYAWEMGRRLHDLVVYTPSGFTLQVIQTREPLLINTGLDEASDRFGSYQIPGTAQTAAFLGVPSLVGETVVAVITLESSHENAFTPADVRLLSTLAASLGVALENARLFAETKRLLNQTEQRAAELAVINSVQEGLVAQLDFQAIINLIGDKLRAVLKTGDISIRMYDAATNLVHYVYEYEHDQRLAFEPRPLQGLSKLIVERLAPVVLNSGLAEWRASMGNSVLPGTDLALSVAGIPILARGEAIGLIVIENYERENAFTDTDVRLLSTLSSSMSVALENARLFTETKRLLDETEQRAAELAVINSVQQGLAAKLDFQALIDLVGDQIRDIFSAQEMAIRLIDPASGHATYPYALEEGRRIKLPPSTAGPKGFNGHVVATRQPLVINEKMNERELEFGSNTFSGTGDTLSWLGVPIIVGDLVTGVISLESFHENAFSDSDVRLLSTLAASLGVALENARLFAETRRLLDVTQQRNAELAVINSVQQGLVAQLDFQAIIDLVGDKISEVLRTNNLGIRLYDPQSGLVSFPYEFEHGSRLLFDPQPAKGVVRAVLDGQAPVVINRHMAERMAELGSFTLPGTDVSKSMAAVPILARGAAVGIIMLENYEREDAYSEADVRLLSTLAASLGVALENARLFAETKRLLDETQQRAAELAVINTVQQGLAAQLDTQAIYDLVGEKLRAIFDAQVFTITSYDLDQHLAELRFGVEDGQRVYDVPYPYSKTAERLIATRQPWLVNYDPAVLAPDQMPDITPGTRTSKTALFVPLVLGEQVIGAVSLQNLDRYDAFGDAEVRLLTTLASSLAVALENARLFAETKRLLSETEQRAAELAVINSVQQGLVAEVDFQGIIDLVGDKLREVLRTGDLSIRLIDDDTQFVQFVYNYEHNVRAQYPPVPLANTSLTRHVAANRQPLRIDRDVQRVLAEFGGITIIPGSDSALSIMAVPIIARDRVLAVIDVESFEREAAFGDSDLRLLSTLAASMGVALENARLFGETKRLLDETQQRAAELAVINTVQQGLAAQLDTQAIYDLVGETLRSIFDAQVFTITSYDHVQRLAELRYGIEDGQRVYDVPFSFSASAERLISTRQPWLVNFDSATRQAGLEENLTPGTRAPKTALFVPLVLGEQVIGSVSLQNLDRFNAFGDAEVRLLTTLASSLAVALENARLFAETKRLLDETQQRNAELAVINSVQQGLVAQLDFQGIIDLVGDKLREVLNTGDIGIRMYDSAANRVDYVYEFEHGERLVIDSRSPAGVSQRVLASREPLLIASDVSRELGLDPQLLLPGTDVALSFLAVPIMARGEPMGLIIIENYERENAFSDADVRLLTTLASSMSVALQNAQLFAVTKRLLDETQQRNAELAVINSVQQGLVAQLDFQGIINLVGDKLREVLQTGDIGIRMYDSAANRVDYLYEFEHGERLMVDASTPRGITQMVLTSRAPVVVNTDTPGWMVQNGITVVPGTDLSKSLAAVPILARDEAMGLIIVENFERENAFSEADVRLLNTLASSMSVALQNAQLFAVTKRLLDETQQRNAELAIINGVGQALAAQLDPQAIFDLVGDKIREVFDAKAVTIEVYDSATNMCSFVYLFEDGQRYYLPPEIQPTYGFTAHLLRTRQPLMINTNVAERAQALGSFVSFGEAAKSYLGVPLIVGDEARGVISLQNTERENAFTESDQRLLTTLASSLSVAFENARLFAEIKRRAGELAALTDIGREISASLDLPTVLARISTSARDLLVSDSSAVFLLEPDGQTLTPIAVVGIDADAIRETRSQMGVGLIGIITQAGQAEIVRDAVNDPRGIQIAGTQQAAEEQMMLAPLQAGDRTIGAMVVWRESQQSQFGQPDLDFLTGLARQAAIAIQNARLFEQAQSRASETAALNQIGREISATLDQTTVLERIAQYARHLLSGGTSAVYLLEPDGRTLRVLVALGDIAEQVRDTRVTLGQGIIGNIARNGMGEYVNNTAADKRAVHIANTPDNDEGQKLMAVPLQAKDGLLGAMAIWRGAADPGFGETDLDFLDGLARQAAIAIQNARLFAEIQRQKDYAGALVENSPVAIVTTDLDGNVVSWNPGAEKLFGYAPPEAIGRSLDELVARDEALHAESQAVNAYTLQGRHNLITRRNRRDGSLVDVELSGVPVMVDGRPAGFIGIYHDISELQRARQEAETANQAKSAFLATMSHEIRTPMNAVIGMSGLLLDTELSDDQREFAEIIRSSSDSLLAIINDILDFSKIEAGKMDLEHQPFDLRECIEGTLDLVANRAFEKGLDLAYELEDGLPTAITGDATRLRQILLNLLTNAVKFTDHGEVVLNVNLDGGSQNGGANSAASTLLFTVRDTGVGIAPDRMHRLFQSFSQVDASTARKYGGTGLGLAISKRLAEMMGGRMWAESAGVPGQGSRFHFTIQAAPAPELAAAPTARRALAGAQPLLQDLRVLIVDDNDTNRRILTLQTQKWGMRPRDTASPREALSWIERGDSFDVAILDMHMPEMDGVALAGAIRRQPQAADLPLVLFTSLGRREMESGGLFFAAHISKPIKPSQLFDALSGVFAGRLGEATAAQRPSAEPAARPDTRLAERHPLRLLLAEDNPVNQKLALRLLGQMGYRADVAGNGLEVLDALVRQPYDVVLMDVQMPEMDGLEASRQINKRWSRSERPRIIAMTANAMAGDREMCLAAGMDDYLTKPIRVPQLVAALENSRPRAAAGETPMTEPAISAATLEELAASTDRDFVRELIDTYLDDSPRLLAEMRQGLTEAQASTVQRAAHSLKSNSASLGAHMLSAQAKELEQAAKLNDLNGAPAKIDQLAALYAQVETELRGWKNGA